MNWNKLREKIIGLSNLGTTSCYINAALQCLASTPPLVDWIFEENHHLASCK
jgi:ubiquitin C-terminal hydrolase